METNKQFKLRISNNHIIMDYLLKQTGGNYWKALKLYWKLDKNELAKIIRRKFNYDNRNNSSSN